MLARHAVIIEVTVCDVAFILNVNIVAVVGIEAFILIYVLEFFTDTNLVSRPVGQSCQ